MNEGIQEIDVHAVTTIKRLLDRYIVHNGEKETEIAETINMILKRLSIKREAESLLRLAIEQAESLIDEMGAKE